MPIGRKDAMTSSLRWCCLVKAAMDESKAGSVLRTVGGGAGIGGAAVEAAGGIGRMACDGLDGSIMGGPSA